MDSLNVVYQGACALKLDGTLDCWGAGVGNVASPLVLVDTPVEQVALQTTCSSTDIRTALRYLSTDSTLHHATLTVTPQCP